MTDGNPLPGLKDTSSDLTRKASVVVRVLEQALQEVPLARIGGPHITSILAAHGYPSTKAMAANIRALKPLGDLPVTFDIPTPPVRDGKTPCPECSRYYPTGAGIANHIRRAHTEKEPAMPTTFDCPDCGTTYKHRRSRDTHRLSVHVAIRPGGRAAS